MILRNGWNWPANLPTWIIDPERQAVVVHQLTDDQYFVHGEYGRGQVALSALLAGFAVDVGPLFATAENIPE